jgi:hypothetical protein
MNYGQPLSDDFRFQIRALLEVFDSSDLVQLDLSDLVDAGYYDADESLCDEVRERAAHEHAAVQNIIVVTEGASDADLIERTLKLLHPELAGFFTFLDFSSTRNPGGAGFAVSLVKGFAAAGIQNRVLAILDNDTAASVALKGMGGVRLPSHMKVIRLPHLSLADSYPTVGPQGDAVLVDVNGLAASLEMYFGEDVLRDLDGALVPVEWRGLDHSLGRYQGELLRKDWLQERFKAKLSRAESDTAYSLSCDWSGMEAVLNAMFDAFKG